MFHGTNSRLPLRLGAAGLFLCLTAFGGLTLAQQLPLTIDRAVERALDRYPAVRVSTEQVSAAAAAINLARTSYLPRADFLGQFNRGTHNNVFGLLLPPTLSAPVISTISGPVLNTNSLDSVWGSAVGLLVLWEPIDFVSEGASVELAKSQPKACWGTTRRNKTTSGGSGG